MARAKRRVTLTDVAKASGFSPSAVSLVLNEAPLARYIPDKTKLKITEAAQRLGYRPDVFARSLRSQRSHTIGILVIDLADPFCTLILQGIERSLLPTDYLPIVMDAHNQPQQVERYLEMMLDRRVEGLITVANWLLFDIALIEDIDDGRIPTVVVGRDLESPTINSILVDNEAGGYAALQHIHSLGHREIAFIRGPRRVGDSRFRWKGIRRFAKEAGLRLNPALVRELSGAMDSSSGFEGGRRLTTELIRSGEPFTAVVAFDDLTAYGVIRALDDAGLRVPEDCSVIGFDGIPAAGLSTPSLTTIQQPMVQMGATAAEFILRQLEHGADAPALSSEGHLFAPELVVRQSTARRKASRTRR
jgi:DNA-binding LacI/PurR family transcriptional regulator